MRKVLIILSLLYCGISLHATDDDMPVIAFLGVPEWQTTEENFRVFSECGFTVSLYPYQSLSMLVKACRYADQYGVKVLGRCPEMYSSPRSTANTLRQEPGFFGYYMQDEPTAPQISERQAEIQQLRQADSTHVFYINLYPYYNPKWVEPALKTRTYPEYLQTASATSCQQLSFDHYPVLSSGIRPTWYHNLEMVRQESLACGKPFWGFVLSVPHDVPSVEDTVYPIPTLGSLRLQVYSNLAYGAQAIQYFTYWTPKSANHNYHDAPIDFDGNKTKTYDLVQQMNRELKTVSKLFYGAKIVSVGHLGHTLPEGTTRQTRMPRNIRGLKIIGSKGAIVSQFIKNSHRYLAIVNKNHEDTLQVLIKARNKIPCHITKDLKEEPMKTAYIVSPGDLLLFRLK